MQCFLIIYIHTPLRIQQEEGNAPESKPPASYIPVITCKPSHTFMVKYYGALPVAVGTGIETVEEAAKVIIRHLISHYNNNTLTGEENQEHHQIEDIVSVILA